MRSSIQEETQRKEGAPTQQQQQNQDAVRVKHAGIFQLNGFSLRSCMLSSNSFTSEECHALLEVVCHLNPASSGSRGVLQQMLDEHISSAMSAEPPELPPRLDYTCCPTHGNTDQLCIYLCNLPEVKDSFRPEEKKARSIKTWLH